MSSARRGRETPSRPIGSAIGGSHQIEISLPWENFKMPDESFGLRPLSVSVVSVPCPNTPSKTLFYAGCAALALTRCGICNSGLASNTSLLLNTIVESEISPRASHHRQLFTVPLGRANLF